MQFYPQNIDLGGDDLAPPLLSLNIEMLFQQTLPNYSLKHPIRQAHCLHFLLHVHLCINLRGRNAAMTQYLADRVEFRTCRYR